MSKSSKRKSEGDKGLNVNAVPNKPKQDERDLELQTAHALRGAADFRNRLLIAMAVGSPSIFGVSVCGKGSRKRGLQDCRKGIAQKKSKQS
jgi:hypothetical protein